MLASITAIFFFEEDGREDPLTDPPASGAVLLYGVR